MSADPVVYCLEHITDYSQFERFCSDVMSQSGYPDIEPLGGSSDGGRDALHLSRANHDEVTIFAYSVREDWKRKLIREDCVRIRGEDYTLDRLVFVCTAAFTTTERDEVKNHVRDEFGWDLELYGLERLRILIAGQLRHLIARHPAIFCPPFFSTRGGLSIAASRDYLVVDHALNDHALATWLARRLQIAGYPTWCYGTAPLAGENADSSVRTLIEYRAARYLPILSASSIADADFVGRCGLACGREDLTIPCHASDFDVERLPAKMRSIAVVPFVAGWGDGLRTLLKALESAGVPAIMHAERGKAIALRSYVPETVTRPSPEPVYTNTFKVEVPASILVCELTRALTTAEEEELRRSWAFVKASAEVLLAFEAPPNAVPVRRGRRFEEYAWRDVDHRHGKWSLNVVKELVRRSMDVACYDAGMRWCEHRRTFFFSQDNDVHRKVSFVHVDGRSTWVALSGQKTQGSGERGRPFRYQLCPRVRVGFDEDGACWLTMRIYVRITDCNGVPHEKKAITRRRKTVTKSWWNKQWFARTLGIMQVLSDGDGTISVGTGKRRVVVSCCPMKWSCPTSIDYRAVERAGDFQQEMAELRYCEDDDDLNDDDEIEGSEAAMSPATGLEECR